MVNVVWTMRSLNDLEDIGDYISKDSIRYAQLTLEKLIDTASLIENNPLLGRIVPESDDKLIREIIKGNYRIIYQIRNNNTVYILTVFHSSRLFSKKDFE
jgi:addiction module RelE/StbE family toxin